MAASRISVAWSLVLFLFFAFSDTFASRVEHCSTQIQQSLRALTESKPALVAQQIPTIEFEDAVAGRLPFLEKVPIYDYQTPEKGYITVLDLSSPLVRGNPHVERALDVWGEHTQSVYQSRLKKFMPKSPETSNTTIASIDFSDRTVVILHTSRPINENSLELHGGIRVVFARKPEEHLPFQQDFPDYVRANPHAMAAEAGRLTGSGSMPLLVRAAMQVIEQYPQVENLYVHTSRSHVLLYRQVGAIAEHTDTRDKLNVILRFGKKEIHNIVDHTKQQIGTN